MRHDRGRIVAAHAVLVGKPDFLRSEKIADLEPLEASAVKLQEDGKTAMFVAINGQAAGVLAVADPIKATTAEAIKELHALGLEIVMLTGDNRLGYQQCLASAKLATVTQEESKPLDLSRAFAHRQTSGHIHR